MGYAVGDLGTSLGHGEVWIGVSVWCYTECNNRGVRQGRIGKLIPMGSFDVGQEVHQLWTW